MPSPKSSSSTDTKDEVSLMPVWLDDTHIDPAWIRAKTGLGAISCSVADKSNQTRRGETVQDGATLLLSIHQKDPSEGVVSLIIKQVPEAGRALSRQLGLAREALFYQQLSGSLTAGSSSSVPKTYYATGDMSTGQKCVIMEDLSANWVDSGIFFGPGNPNNWSRDLPTLVAATGLDPVPDSAEVATSTFTAMARVHATFWRDATLLSSERAWLRGQEWLQGKGRDSWEASQQLVRNFWNTCQEKETKTGQDCIEWDPIVKAAAAQAVAGISWVRQLERLNEAGHWTLVHGDYWPGNVMWNIEKKCDDASKTRLLDWEMTGLGSGPQDLGQYILSNMDPVERRACERQLIEAYHKELLRAGVDVTWDYCWEEYKIGGLERWLWFLIYFVGQEGLTDWAQFFHNQISAFMHDHELAATDIVQPRP